MPDSNADLAKLPLRLHVVVGELEMTLGQAQQLTAGTVLQLDQGKDEPVGLAINGKLAGHGQLVEIDGKLGVKILSWSDSG
ncbi:MAG: FliM/FliN family flagellar motor switch protein [Acidobacteria bacterium]|nr:FliM/FliN family flagellar motor switch protein [Acidobacteriota bacterium]MBI3471943.1 FliM/FliN family flagellar motor switch protein [Candidatus Solibacter usitatus]